MARHPPDHRIVVIMFPCGRCGETAEWTFPASALSPSKIPAYGGAQCTKCGYRVVTKVELREPELFGPDE